MPPEAMTNLRAAKERREKAKVMDALNGQVGRTCIGEGGGMEENMVAGDERRV